MSSKRTFISVTHDMVEFLYHVLETFSTAAADDVTGHWGASATQDHRTSEAILDKSAKQQIAAN